MQSMIRLYRKQKGMTQQELADVIGRSRSTVAEYELGTTGVPNPILWKIARCLEVQVDVLFEDDVPTNGDGATHE